MGNFNYFEIIGFVATVILVIAYLFHNLLTVRKINTVACVIFVIYGILIKAYSVVLSNSIIAIIHIVNIIRESRSNK